LQTERYGPSSITRVYASSLQTVEHETETEIHNGEIPITNACSVSKSHPLCETRHSWM